MIFLKGMITGASMVSLLFIVALIFVEVPRSSDPIIGLSPTELAAWENRDCKFKTGDAITYRYNYNVSTSTIVVIYRASGEICEYPIDRSFKDVNGLQLEQDTQDSKQYGSTGNRRLPARNTTFTWMLSPLLSSSTTGATAKKEQSYLIQAS